MKFSRDLLGSWGYSFIPLHTRETSPWVFWEGSLSQAQQKNSEFLFPTAVNNDIPSLLQLAAHLAACGIAWRLQVQELAQ